MSPIIYVTVTLIAVLALTGLVIQIARLPSSSLTVDEVRKMCTEKLREMFDGENPKLSVNTCVGTALS